MNEEIRAQIADAEGPKQLVPNRRDIRRAGGTPGLYRQPRRTPRGPAKNHWLVTLREEKATQRIAALRILEQQAAALTETEG